MQIYTEEIPVTQEIVDNVGIVLKQSLRDSTEAYKKFRIEPSITNEIVYVHLMHVECGLYRAWMELKKNLKDTPSIMPTDVKYCGDCGHWEEPALCMKKKVAMGGGIKACADYTPTGEENE